MNQEEQDAKDRREEKYSGTQSDIRLIKNQLDKLTNVVGDQSTKIQEMTRALKGDDFGGDGLAARVKDNEFQISVLKTRVDNAELAAKKKEFYLYTIWTLIGLVGGSLVTLVMKYLMSK